MQTGTCATLTPATLTSGPLTVVPPSEDGRELCGHSL